MGILKYLVGRLCFTGAFGDFGDFYLNVTPLGKCQSLETTTNLGKEKGKVQVSPCYFDYRKYFLSVDMEIDAFTPPVTCKRTVSKILRVLTVHYQGK